MSGGEDKDSKTEEPTEKKIADAVEKGNVPASREAAVFASLLGILIALGFLTGGRVGPLMDQMALFFDDPGGFRLETGTDATMLLSSVTKTVGVFLIPIVLVLALAGVAASILQNAPQFAGERIRPQWSRISLAKGWSRTFGAQGLVEFLKTLFKFAAVSVVCAILLRSEQAGVVNAMFSDPAQFPAMVLAMATRLVSAVCVATIVLVALDLVWSRLRWRSDLRMTRQEVKDELKQSEGDPLVKSRQRSIARHRARDRMMSAVPRASLVVANPTHYAIALRYDRGEGGAPVVVAKGADHLALRIREIAAEHRVPIIEDRLLARALYDAVQVDQWIPPEFYRPVAKILYFIYARDTHDRPTK
jgi:flagellar biosynthetic protein FlhB